MSGRQPRRNSPGRQHYILTILTVIIIAVRLGMMRGTGTKKKEISISSGIQMADKNDDHSTNGTSGTSSTRNSYALQQPPLYEEGDWSSLWWLPQTGTPRANGVQVKVEATTTVDEDDLPHLIFVPEGDAPSGGWPLLVFLHGQGESSGVSSLDMVALQGPPQQAGRHPHTMPFAVLSPQKPIRSEFFHPDVASGIANLIRRYVSEFDVDDKRVYLTGLSQGGIGTWSLGSDPIHSKVFAAIAPVCGGLTTGDVERRAAALADMPIWAFHGENDSILPVSLSVNAIKAVSATKRTAYAGEAKFTRIPKARGEDYAWKAIGVPFMQGHASWVDAYYPPGMRVGDHPPLYEWLLSFRRAGVE